MGADIAICLCHYSYKSTDASVNMSRDYVDNDLHALIPYPKLLIEVFTSIVFKIIHINNFPDS